MTLTDARTFFDTTISELEDSADRDLLAGILLAAREVLETTTPDDERTEAECANTLRLAALSLPTYAAGFVAGYRHPRA